MPDRAISRGVAVVTGAGQRIGHAIARALARERFAVAIHVRRSEDQGRSLAAEIEGKGGRAIVVVADLEHPSEIAPLVERASAAGELTLLVNNASIFEPDTIGALSREHWDRQLSVNLTAPVFLAEAFAGRAADGASIVNVIDQRVFKPTPHFLAYTVAKSALATATITLAQALAPRIRVNGVAPGPTLPSARQDVAAFARQTASLPLGRGPTPEDIADAVVFLAGAHSVTGAILPVDGGQHIAWRTPDADVSE